MSDFVERLLWGRKGSTSNEDNEWMPVSDLMAGLMVVFLFIAIALMQNAFRIAESYDKTQKAIYQALVEEFEEDLEKWGAEIHEKDLAVNFKSPEVLFDRGEIRLKPRFKKILDDFFPRYLNVLLSFRRSIREVRIEGHTSSIWNKKTTETEAYFNNMMLSQGRTLEVLEYVYLLEEVGPYQEWVKKHVAAVGYSSAHVILKPDGTEDLEQSRRVSFRVITNADEQLYRILGRGS